MHHDFFVAQTVYSVCALAFILLIVLMVLRGRTSKAGLGILACCLASVIWAGATAAAVPIAVLALLDSIRLSTWLCLRLRSLPQGPMIAPVSDELFGLAR